MLLLNITSNLDFFFLFCIETRLTFQFYKFDQINDPVFELYKQHRNQAL